MGLFTTGNTNTSIESLTYGVSKSGMQQYVEDLRLALLTKVKEKLNDVTAIQNAIDASWQGTSRDKFYKDFENSIEKINNDLESEFTDLNVRLTELANNYYKQDKDLMN